jgi:U3 small nucleolar ribonucleoprotein component
MKGEISSKNRPANSLLEKHLEFDTVGAIDPDIQRSVEDAENEEDNNKSITELIENTIKTRIIEDL